MALNGIGTVLRNLNREIKKIKNDSLKGLILVAIAIRRGMDEHAPTIPIDTGNLRASWFTDSKHTMWGPSVTMGFTAEYAFKVHEMVGANFAGSPHLVKRTKKGNVTAKTKKYLRRKDAGAKFFEASIKREAPHALKTIKGAAVIR